MNTEFVKLLDAIAGLNVIVIGEAMLDCYLVGYSDRLCPEAPVPVVTVTQRHQAPGGAANTAVNVRALGGNVTFLSVIGDDGEGAMLQQTLLENGVSTQNILTQPGRKTLSKQRLMAASQLLMRFDWGSTEAINSETEQALIAQLTSSFVDCDALIVADYGYGILTAGVIEAIAKLQHASPRVLVVDSKHLAAYRHLNVTAVKPNYQQAIQLLGLEALPTKSLSEHQTRAISILDRDLSRTAAVPLDTISNSLGGVVFAPNENRYHQIVPHGEKLLELTGAQIVAVTLDAEGAIVFERTPSESGQQQLSSHRIASVRASQSRTSGAGDTFVSTLTLALAAKAPMPVAAELASAAAAVVVGKDGTTACSVQELRQYLQVDGDKGDGEEDKGSSGSPRSGDEGRRGQGDKGNLEQSSPTLPLSLSPPPLLSRPSPLTYKEKLLTNLSDLSASLEFYRANGRRIVFTNGCFDILHAGHVSYLNRARCLGDILIVGVNSDASVSRLKGLSRPINLLLDRIQVLAALSCVDRLISFEEDSPMNLIRLIRPDVYVKGGDYTKETLPEAPMVEALGGVVEILPFLENRSTSNIIQRICQQSAEE